MKTTMSLVFPLDCRHRVSFLICVILTLLFPVLVSSDARKNEQGNAYPRKLEDHPQFSKNNKQSKESLPDNGNSNSMVKHNEDHRSKQPSKVDEASPALEKFLDDVLKAQDDLQWIDHAIRNVGHEKGSKRSNRHSNKQREKRAGQSYENMWDAKYRDENPMEYPRRMYFDNDMAFKRNMDLNELDAPPNGVHEKKIHLSPLYDKQFDDQIPKDWTKTKDLCSLSDWLNSNKNSEIEQDKSGGDPWIRDYQINNRLSSADLDKEANVKANARRSLNLRDQRDETKNKEVPSLESLKQTILELKKSLNESGKKQHESKNVGSAKTQVDESDNEKQTERKTRAKSKHRKDENDEEVNPNWWENLDTERLDLKKREEGGSEDLDEKNAYLKVWRTKRTEVNNDDGNPKLFHRAGFGEPYLEEGILKELHERERRSKGTLSDEKRRLNEDQDKNNREANEKNSMEISNTVNSGCNEVDTSDRKISSSNEDALNVNSSVTQKESNKSDETGNFEQSDRSRKGVSKVEEKSTKGGENGESVAANHSQSNLRSTRNEQQVVSPAGTANPSRDTGEVVGREGRMQKTEANQESVRSEKREQVIEASQPQRHPYEDGQRAKKVRTIDLGCEVCEGTSTTESGNIDILVKSENKNLIEFSKKEDSLFADQPPTLNVINVKRRTIVENEEKPGKSVSTVLNVNIEKARVDTPDRMTVKRQESSRRNDIPFGNGAADTGKDEVKEVPYEDTPVATANSIEPRVADEKRLKNSVEFNKGSKQRGVNEKGTGNWLVDAVRDRMDMKQGAAAQDCNELAGKEKLQNTEAGFSDDKGRADIAEDSRTNEESKDANDRTRNKKKYHEIFIMTNGMDDRVMNDRYSHRRILQYMEYSNDDVEDADLSYSDKEEEENQREGSADKNDATARRKERSTDSGNRKAKVNMLIRRKLDKKKGRNEHSRKRRNPSVIEYYDYDADLDQQQDHEALSQTSEQERGKGNYQDKTVIESDSELETEDTSKDGSVPPPILKKSEYEIEMEKHQKWNDQLKNKLPQQQFIGLETGSETVADITTAAAIAAKSNDTSSTGNVKSTEEEGLVGNQQPGSRLNEPSQGQVDRFMDSETKEAVLDPAKYILKVDKSLNPCETDELFQGVRSVDEKKVEPIDNLEHWYEELKKVYDWSNEDETKSKPRIKGDQRMHYEADDKLHPKDKIGEQLKDQAEPPEVYPDTGETSGKFEIGERAGQLEGSAVAGAASNTNVTRSNYFALKSTDDMFKGGSEQSNSTEEKLRGLSGIGGAAAEWRVQKVNRARNGEQPEKDAASWSLTDRKKYIDTDSRSPCENRKYQESRERVQNIDRAKQTIISSGDLHESFVEPLDWIDDFDKDIRVRLSRSLKTVETNTPGYTETSATRHEQSTANSTGGTAITTDSTPSKVATESNVALVVAPSLDIQRLFESRVKRDTAFPYDTFYDDVNQHHRDSERMDYSRYSKNEDKMNNKLQLLSSYEDMDNKSPEKYPSSGNKLVDYRDILEHDDDGYNKIARSASSSKRQKHGDKKKHHDKGSKQQKRKNRTSKSSKSWRKRRHHKKHSTDSKAKSRNKKRKKTVSKNAGRHTNVKKSKASQDEETVHGGRKPHRNKIHKQNANVVNDNQKRGISSLLTAENIEDESQMDSALHGELAGRIVEQIFEQVQSNDDLKTSLGPGLYQRHKTRDTVAADKLQRETETEDDIKHTEELLNKIMMLLNRLIFDEVQRKTCISLPSDLMEFLGWMLEVNPEQNMIEQPLTLSFTPEEQSRNHSMQDKFLFKSFPNEEIEAEIGELSVKIQLIKNLIKEYSALTEKDKEKIETIHKYLAKQLDLLLVYIEEKEDAEKKGKPLSLFAADRRKNGRILQYQGGMGNTSKASHSTSPNTFTSLMYKPDLVKLNNSNLHVNRQHLHKDIIGSHTGRRMTRSLDKPTRRNKKQRKRRKKHGKRHKGASAIDQPRYKDTVHKAATLRQKREYLDKAYWDSSDSGYEEPLIYNSMDMKNMESSGNSDDAFRKEENLKDTDGKSARSDERRLINDRKEDDTADGEKATIERDVSKTAASIQSEEQSNFNEDKEPLEEEPITGKNRLEDEMLLMNKRQAWKMKNEQQLEEVAFGEDMRRALRDKELFEKLTEIDKIRNELSNATQNTSSVDHARNNRNSSCDLSNEDKLRMLEEKINVYADDK